MAENKKKKKIKLLILSNQQFKTSINNDTESNHAANPHSGKTGTRELLDFSPWWMNYIFSQ